MVPPPEEVRDQVARDWAAARREEGHEALYQKWLGGCSFTVEELAEVGRAGQGEAAEVTYDVVLKVPARGPDHLLFVLCLMIVAGVATQICRWVIRRAPSPQLWQPAAAYVIGTIATYWTIDRIAGI